MGLRGRGFVAKAVTLTVAAASAVGAFAPAAAAAPGDRVADLLLPDAPKGVSVAFDGKYLYYTELNGLTLNRIGTDGVTGRDSVAIVGAPGINALTYDATKDKFWAVDATGLTFYLVDKSGAATLQFAITPVTHLPGLCGNTLGCSPVVDGLAYDSITDTLWYSPKGSQRVYHFSTVGDYLGYVDANLAPECTAFGTAGVAAGRNQLYVTSSGCARTFEYTKNNALGTAARTADFLSFTGKAADAECDSTTFATHVLWVRDAEDGHVRAFELPAGMCYGGGGVPMPNQTRMTGGGETEQELPQPPPPSGGSENAREIHHGFTIHCFEVANATADPMQPAWELPAPNNAQFTWKTDLEPAGNPDGKYETHRAHLVQVVNSKCYKGAGDPEQRVNTIEWEGFFRVDGKPCAVSLEGANFVGTGTCGYGKFKWRDGGEPGSQPGPDWTDLLTVDQVDPKGLIVSGCDCPLPSGNYQIVPANL